MKTPSTHYDDGVILLDLSSSKPIAISGAAGALGHDDQSRNRGETCSIPDEVLKTILSAKRSELGTLRMPFRIGKDQYICRVYPLENADGSDGCAMVALYLHRGGSSAEAVHALAAAYELTQREQEALLGISAGLTCKEVAERMQISPNTVKAYLRLIMVKMGVTRRAGIMGKLLEQTTGGTDHADRRMTQSEYDSSVKNGVNGSARNGAGQR